jgi:hypothetical protein
MFRAGTHTLDSFANDKGEWLTLEELRQKAGSTFAQPRGEFTVYDGAYPKVKPDVSTPARAAAVALEDRIRLDEAETGAFIDFDGRIIVQKTGPKPAKGEPKKVTFTERELRGTYGSVFTHNHPGNRPFSPEDVEAAIAQGLTELRAAGPTLRYQMQRKGPTWPTIDELHEAFAATVEIAGRRVARMIAQGELEPQFAQAESEHQHWRLVAQKLGLKYNREKS